MSVKQINKIKEILEKKIQPQVIEIIDESDEHLGHVEAEHGMHLQIKLVAKIFDNLNLVQRHKMIYSALGNLPSLQIHALGIKVFTPSEYAQLNT